MGWLLACNTFEIPAITIIALVIVIHSQGFSTCIVLQVVLTSGKALGMMPSAMQASLLRKNSLELSLAYA